MLSRPYFSKVCQGIVYQFSLGPPPPLSSLLLNVCVWSSPGAISVLVSRGANRNIIKLRELSSLTQLVGSVKVDTIVESFVCIFNSSISRIIGNPSFAEYPCYSSVLRMRMHRVLNNEMDDKMAGMQACSEKFQSDQRVQPACMILTALEVFKDQTEIFSLHLRQKVNSVIPKSIGLRTNTTISCQKKPKS